MGSRKKLVLGKTVFALLLMITVTGSALAQTTYRVVDLGVLRGGSARVHAISANGNAVGGSGFVYGTGRHAFFWGQQHGIQDIGTLPGGDFSEAFAINNAGQVAGTSNTASSMRAFLWTSATGLQDLGTLPRANASQAYAINEAGQVVGASGTDAVLWTNGLIQDIGGLPGSDWSEAHGINNAGQVVGFSNTTDGQRAFLWSGNTIQDLGTLPGDSASRANLINDHGVVIGASEGRNGVRAFAWTATVGMQTIPTLPGGSYSEAFGVNNAGQVVGASGSSFGTRAFMWSPSTGVIDLNDVVKGPANLVLTGAFAINDNGYIVAFGIQEPNLGAHQEARGDVHIHHAGTRVYMLIPR